MLMLGGGEDPRDGEQGGGQRLRIDPGADLGFKGLKTSQKHAKICVAGGDSKTFMS